MYTNCQHHPVPSRRPLEFKLPLFQEDERLAFVDSVCATLMTSRFGDGAMYTLNPRFEGTADEPFDFLDVLEQSPIGWHDVARLLGRTILGRAFSSGSLQRPARSKGIALTDTSLGQTLTTLSPANLARGSPNTSETFFFASSLRT